jgi:hypothetical protein
MRGMANGTAGQAIIWGGALALAVVLYSVEFVAGPRHDFVHAVHYNFKPDCELCHVLDPQAALPRLDEQACLKCHDERGTPPWRLPGDGRPLRGINFKHADHARGRECVDCHRTTVEGTHQAGAPVVAPSLCLDCHADARNEKRIARRECARCHDSDRKRATPPNHDRTWLSRHGRELRWESAGDHGERCSQCHGNSACVACHRSQRPVSHNGLWRLRLHGTAARWDRDRCRTCHETGACVACHRRTPPQNHRGPWRSIHGLAAKSKLDDRCTTCHTGAWCTSCHKGLTQ